MFSQTKLLEKESVEQVSRAFIKSFQINSYDAMFELFPPKKKVIQAFESMLPDGTKKETIIQNINNVYTAHVDNYYHDEFNHIVEKGKKVGVDWRRLKLINIEYDIEDFGTYSIANPTFLTCKNKNTVHTIEIHCIKLDDGWYVLPIIDGEARLGTWADPVELKEFRKEKKKQRREQRA